MDNEARETLVVTLDLYSRAVFNLCPCSLMPIYLPEELPLLFDFDAPYPV
jgi:hypothetical protein